jgi:hypothetical protein
LGLPIEFARVGLKKNKGSPLAAPGSLAHIADAGELTAPHHPTNRANEEL